MKYFRRNVFRAAKKNKDTYIAVTDGLEIVWLLKEVES